MKRLLTLLLLLSILLSGCIVTSDSTRDEATKDEATIDEAIVTEAPTEPPDVTEQAMTEYEHILGAPLEDDFAEVDIDPIDQFPELPAGCEAVSLTMAINAYGYDLGKTDIVDNWLEYGSSIVDSYVGDPHIFLNGAGIYPPGLVKTVWNFVEDTGARLYPIDTTEVAFEDLFLFIQAGYPVVLWSTYYDAYPIEEGGAEVRDGIVYQWYRNEHCVVLCGYDLDDGTVVLADPVRGIVTVSLERIENIYDEMGQFSMVMLDTTAYDYPADWTPPGYETDEEDNEDDEDDDNEENGEEEK